MVTAFLMFFVGVYGLTFLMGMFSVSLTAGLVMSGVYVLFITLSIAAYRFYKRAYDWQQGAISRKMKADYLASDIKPCYLKSYDKKDNEAAKRAKQRDEEIAAMTTRT